MAKERFFKVRGYRHTIGEDKAEPFEAIIPAENRKEACSKFWWNIKEPARPIPRWGLYEVSGDAVGRERTGSEGELEQVDSLTGSRGSGEPSGSVDEVLHQA